VLCDDGDGGGDGLAARAAVILAAAGYDDIAVLDGGVAAWAAAGFELFESGYTVVNAFGLYAEAHYGTPRIDGAELMARIAAGEDLVIVDSRPFDEFHAATLPGAVNLPVAELFHRARDLAPDPKTRIVVHCGGKTRGILGCQSLINGGIENPVVSLDEGTMDWELAGGALERGAARCPPPASESAKAWAKAAAQDIATRFGVRTITSEQLAAWQAEAETRSLYLVDVRSRGEYDAGHLPGSVWIPGGQLAGCTQDYIATWNARFCLVDDDGARATLTASWLIQAGWPEVAVLEGGIAGHELERGPEAAVEPAEAGAVASAPASEAKLESHRRGIAWRAGLLEQFDRDGTLRFVPPT
jgi:rhodanese-related sulfurtransferase